MRMRRFLVFCGAVICLSLISVRQSVAGPCSQDNEPSGIFVPDKGCAEVGIGYQYQHYDAFGRTFGNSGYNVNFGIHLFDPLTGAVGRITVGAEGSTAFGFGHTGGTPSLVAKSLFVGGGPHIAIESTSRFEPWIHGLVGLEHLRTTQTATLGSNSTLGFMVGGGLDTRLTRTVYWRVQADYLGTNFQSSIQSDYSIGSGILFYF